MIGASPSRSISARLSPFGHHPSVEGGPPQRGRAGRCVFIERALNLLAAIFPRWPIITTSPARRPRARAGAWLTPKAQSMARFVSISRRRGERVSNGRWAGQRRLDGDRLSPPKPAVRHWGHSARSAAAACAIIGVRAQNGRAFDTDIQNLLPQTALELVVRATSPMRARLGRAGGADFGRGLCACRSGAAILRPRSPPLASRPSACEAAARWIFANRNQLMCEADPARFDANAVIARADALLYSPLAPVSGDLLARDPFLLTLQLAQCLSPQAGAPAGDAALMSGALNASAFRIDVQDDRRSLRRLEWMRGPDVAAARAGAVFFRARRTPGAPKSR